MKLEDFAAGARPHDDRAGDVSWLASQPYVGSVIAGATRPEQVEENAKAADWKLTDDEKKEIDEIMGVQPARR